MEKVTSKDGTAIAFDRAGEGPPVVLVGGATQDRSGNAPLAAILSERFTVFNYDRRGRGDSGDNTPYAVGREIEDLEALIAEAGGSASVYGTSSGGNLALQAAASGLAIAKLVLWEPNFLVDDSRPPLPEDYVEHLNGLISAARRGDAVEYFMTKAVGMPSEFVAPMRDTPMWPVMEVLAHTLAYDGAIVRDDLRGRPLSTERVAPVTIPALVIDGGTTPWMSNGARALADALPDGRHHTLEGQQHNVDPRAIAPILEQFFVGQRDGGGRDDR